MVATISGSGSCLCGKVQFQVGEMKTGLGACHCGMCRKWCGGPFLAIDCGTKVQWQSEEFIHRYASSDWAERGFCKNCGTNLFYYFKKAGRYILTAGLFDNQKDFIFDHQIFIDKKPKYYQFKNQTKEMTEEEVIAHFISAS